MARKKRDSAPDAGTVSADAEPVRKLHPKANSGSFGVGRPGGVAAKEGPSEPPPPLVPVEGEGLLAAIRHVLANADKRLDATTEQIECRKWLKDDRSSFFREKAKLEAAELVAKGKARLEADERAAEDVGSAAALGLVTELLAKYGGARRSDL